MSFGGGGAAASKTKSHLHTNNSDDGGSLNSTSLINEAPLFSLVVAL
jgi:hypothetical protein|tara:strand:+ start:334 stop:474 length:141 start_codon:yes stop_codon:yes gene_type:complete